MKVRPGQADLFTEAPVLPAGFRYRAEFVSVEEERQLLATFATLEFKEARYKEYTARRRVVNYGAGYDFESNTVTVAPALPAFLDPLRARVAEWLAIDPAEFVQALISEYQPGTPLGWHRDVPEYEIVAGVSLASGGRMRFRPYPPQRGRRTDVLDIDLERRSAYVLADEARWGWQHSVPPVKELRYSVTLRTSFDRLRTIGRSG